MLTIASRILPTQLTSTVPLPSQNVTSGLGYLPSLYKGKVGTEEGYVKNSAIAGATWVMLEIMT
jgi:hypothetical protein